MCVIAAQVLTVCDGPTPKGATLIKDQTTKKFAAAKAGAKRGSDLSLSPRVAERSTPDAWGMDELMSLREAVELHWPNGPLTVASLRITIRDGKLPVCEIARKHLVTRRCLMELSKGVKFSAAPKTEAAGPGRRLSPGGMTKTEARAIIDETCATKKPQMGNKRSP